MLNERDIRSIAATLRGEADLRDETDPAAAQRLRCAALILDPNAAQRIARREATKRANREAATS